jgi:hypothetical protein
VLGYKRKPIWIYLVSTAFIISPFCNYMLSLYLLGVRRWYSPRIWGAWIEYLDPWSVLAMVLVFAAGISIMFFVRKWSWMLSLAALIMVFSFTVIRWHEVIVVGPIIMVALMVGTLGAAAVVYASNFRQPYLNPRLRWWETSTRYRADIPAQVGEAKHKGVLVDISRSGLLIQWDKESQIPDLKKEVEVTISDKLSLTCAVARRTPSGYGLAFTSLKPDEKKGLKAFLKALSEDPRQVVR